uniref:Uncharacterized protein n=1 Tax=Aceria tosichella TaxID=561515 RepID=A0A6G1SQW1_9ACAR
MDESVSRLTDILGQERLENFASPAPNLMNNNEIHCDCKTVILKPHNAKLIVPTGPMLEIENELRNYQKEGKIFNDIIRGCYWLVDDMYKFEHMAFTKEINEQNLSQANNPSALKGLRYLACAECNLCPLGWFDPSTKESYLHLWTDKKV